MAFIRKRRSWTSQPQETVELDCSNVIAASARSLILPSLGPTDLVLPSRAITKNANCNTSPSDDGIAYSSSDANSGLIFSGGWSAVVPTSSPITFFARVYVAAVGVRRVLLADWSAAGADESIAVETTAANQWRQYSQGDVRISGGAVSVGWHTIVVSQAASQSSEMWVDGVSIGSSSLALTRGGGSTAAWLDSGAYTGDIGWSTNKASLMAVCEMYADGDIVKSFHDNPWQLFAPQSIWVPVSAGGGSTINGVLGTATASGFPATVNANRAVAASLGTVAASGFPASVTQNATIAGNLGVAAASGFLATVNASTIIAASPGVVAASGFQATVANSSDTTVNGSLGTAVASGFTAGINANTTIAGSLGVAAALGFQATVDNSSNTVIDGALGVVVASGFTAGINASTIIAASSGVVEALGFQASIIANGAVTISVVQPYITVYFWKRVS